MFNQIRHIVKFITAADSIFVGFTAIYRHLDISKMERGLEIPPVNFVETARDQDTRVRSMSFVPYGQ